MGRWGYRASSNFPPSDISNVADSANLTSPSLFEGDMDLDIACTIIKSLGVNTEKWDHAPIQTVNQTDMLAPQGSREHYKTKDYSKQLQDKIVPSVRAKFNANNLGERLMTKSHAKEGKVDVVIVTTGEYKTIILGALMMRVGAKINDEDLQHLRDLVPKVVCIPGTTWALGDVGFRGPGKAQFLAALDAYEPGKPRSFQELR